MWMQAGRVIWAVNGVDGRTWWFLKLRPSWTPPWIWQLSGILWFWKIFICLSGVKPYFYPTNDLFELTVWLIPNYHIYSVVIKHVWNQSKTSYHRWKRSDPSLVSVAMQYSVGRTSQMRMQHCHSWMDHHCCPLRVHCLVFTSCK